MNRGQFSRGCTRPKAIKAKRDIKVIMANVEAHKSEVELRTRHASVVRPEVSSSSLLFFLCNLRNIRTAAYFDFIATMATARYSPKLGLQKQPQKVR
jgi:hypothetical protein